MKLALAAVSLLVCAAAQAQIVVYDDMPENGWDFGYSYGGVAADFNLVATMPVHGGTHSIGFTPDNFNALSVANPMAPVTTASYPIIHFWINGGAGNSQNLNISVSRTTVMGSVKSAPLGTLVPGGIVAGQWHEVMIDITQPPFSYATATYDRIDIQDESGAVQQTVYIDDWSLMPPAGLPPANAMSYDHGLTTLPAVSPMLSDRITWQDSAGHTRTAVLAHDNVGVNNVGYGQVYGSALRQFTYQLSDGSTRTADVTTYGNGGYGGFGYVVDHSNAGNCVGGDDSPLGDYTMASFTPVFEGRHHSIYRYTQLYPRPCPNVVRTVPVTIEWMFSTGRDNPLYAITYDVDQLAPAPAMGTYPLQDDSRAPYGELNIDGDGGTNVDGVAWGDRYKFTSTTTPVTLNSSWTYNVANTVPYVKEWLAGVLTVDHRLDATMGLVQTQTMDQQDAGGARDMNFHDITVLWNTTSATNPANPNGYHATCPYTMPCQNEWAYQANADNLGPATSNNNTRMTWRAQWGFIGQPDYVRNDGTALPAHGYPKQSYEVFVILGQHTASPVEAQVTQIETIQSLVLTINGVVGSVVTSGPAGVARADNVTFSPAGYNHVRGALAFSADNSNHLDANIAVGAGTLKKPLVIIGNYTAAGYPQIKLGGNTLTADADYFASLRSSANELWVTLNRDLAGATNHLEILSAGGGGGVPGAPTIGPATPGNGSVSISFTAPASDGGSLITGYTATCNPGGFNASAGASPILVGGLTSGIQYSCTVTATNANGTGPASAPVLVTLLNNRSFVATSGNDANNCTPSAVCRSFNRAIAMTYPGGEIVALNSGGYGAFAVGNNITVIGAPGITASLTVGVGDGIDIAAAGTDRVTLRGLNITMLNAATGINAMSFGNLSVEGCSVTGGSYGVLITGGAGSFATLASSVVRGASTVGIAIKSHAVLLDSTISGSGDTGLFLQDGAAADAVVSATGLLSMGNANHGVWAKCAAGGHSVSLDLDHSMLTNNLGDGVLADGTGAGSVTVRVTKSAAITNSIAGFAQSGIALFQSMTNNLVAGNGTNTSGAITGIAGH